MTPDPAFGSLSMSRWRCVVKYGWIAFVTMMVALLSTTQVAAQDPYGPEEIGAEAPLLGQGARRGLGAGSLERGQSAVGTRALRSVTAAHDEA